MPSNLPIDGHSFRRVEVLTGVPRRRRWSAAEKAAIVAESFPPGAVASTIALRHGLHRNQLYMWRREYATPSIVISPAISPTMATTPFSAVSIGSHRFHFGSLNEYEVDRLAKDIGLSRSELLGKDRVLTRVSFLPTPADMPL